METMRSQALEQSRKAPPVRIGVHTYIQLHLFLGAEGRGRLQPLRLGSSGSGGGSLCLQSLQAGLQSLANGCI